jgi:alpha-ketoglutarate-dependent 2,4-dichlorophenoxyacetate dioxygenase
MAPITFRQLGPTFGGECIGVDFSETLSPDTIQTIKDGMAKYGVLYFRATNLDDAHHVAFASQFGDLDDATTVTVPSITSLFLKSSV